MTRIQLSLSIVFLLLASGARAQDQGFSAGPGTFSCNGGASFGTLNDTYHLVGLAPLDRAPADLPADKPRVFGPFDGRTIEIYQFLTGTSEGLATGTELHVYIRVRAANGEHWYGLRAGDPDTLSADPPGMEDNGEPPADDSTPKPPAKTDPADISTPDPAVPLLQLTYRSRWMGANASGDTGRMLLLDFRRPAPAVIKQLDCVTGEGGGVCTAPDSMYGSRTSVSCGWKDHDYICQERIATSTGWGERFTDSSYHLLSGKDAYVPPADAVGMNWIGDKLAGQPATGQKLLVPDVGNVTAIYSVQQREHDLYLVAARGTGSTPDLAFAGGSDLDARFFLVERPYRDRPPTSMEIVPTTASALSPITWPEADAQRKQASQPKMPVVSSRQGGAPLSYNVKKLYGDDEFFVLHVTVKEGNQHVVYWIGVDQRSSPIIADLYRLASDAPAYDHCMMFIQEEAVASYRLLPGSSFRAALEVEPMHLTDEEGNFFPDPEGENQAPGQTCTRRIAWDRTKGFVFGENPVCKTAAPRTIVISDSGAITTRPMARSKER